jgi:hypothetical protein
MEVGKRAPLITTDLAVIAARSADSARLRDEHLWPVVLDAMTLIRDVIHNTIPDKEPSGLMDALTVGTARLYGKPDLLQEVADHLPKVVARKGYDLRRAQEVLAFYVNRMRLVDPGGIVMPDAEARFVKVGVRRAAGGRSDEPTARLSRLLDPSILLTADRDLLENDFGLWYEPGQRLATWTAAAFTLKDRSFGSQIDAGGKAFGMAIAAPVFASVGLAQAARAHPRMALGIGAAVAALAFATRKSPRWQTAHIAFSDGFARTAASIAEHIPADAAERGSAARQAVGELRAYREIHASPGSPVAVVARTLAIAPLAGLTPKEIYDSTGHAFRVWPVLDGHPGLFTEDGSGRWYLGIAAQMPG